MSDCVVRQHGPVAFGNHVRHFVAEEGIVGGHGLMTAAGHDRVALRKRPRGEGAEDRSAVLLEVVEQGGGGVW